MALKRMRTLALNGSVTASRPVGNETDAVLSAVLTDDDCVALRIKPRDKHRLAVGAETLALTDRIIYNSVVSAEHVASAVHNITGGRGYAQRGEVGGVIVVRHEAYLLAVVLFGNGQPRTLGNGSYLRFIHARKRENGSRELSLSETVEL